MMGAVKMGGWIGGASDEEYNAVQGVIAGEETYYITRRYNPNSKVHYTKRYTIADSKKKK